MNNRKTVGSNPFETVSRQAVSKPAPTKTTNLEAGVENVRDVSQAIKVLNDTLEEFSELTDSLGKNSNKLEKQTSQASNSAKQVSHSALSLGSSIEKVKNAGKKVSMNTANTLKSSLNAIKAADSTNNVFSSLLESSKDLDKIDKVVAGLSQQINLFALNASIEAARAGEAGRGFSVVANEIKELAKETAKIADDIRYKIDNFYQDTKRAVETLNEVSNLLLSIKTGQSAIDQAIDEQYNALTEVTKHSGAVIKSTNSVTDNILNVYKLSKFSTEGTDKSIRYVHVLSKLSNDLKGLLEQEGE